MEYRLKEKEDGMGQMENNNVGNIHTDNDSDCRTNKLNNFQDYDFTANFEGEVMSLYFKGK